MSCVVRRQQRLRAVPVVAERRIKVHVSLRLTGCQACSAALARRTQFTSFGSAECRVKIKFIQSSDRASHLGIDPDLNWKPRPRVNCVFTSAFLFFTGDIYIEGMCERQLQPQFLLLLFLTLWFVIIRDELINGISWFRKGFALDMIHIPRGVLPSKSDPVWPHSAVYRKITESNKSVCSLKESPVHFYDTSAPAPPLLSNLIILMYIISMRRPLFDIICILYWIIEWEWLMIKLGWMTDDSAQCGKINRMGSLGIPHVPFEYLYAPPAPRHPPLHRAPVTPTCTPRHTPLI